MVKDILEYKGKKYQLSTVKLDGFFETMIFPIEHEIVSGKEVYCFRTTEPGLSIDKHEDICEHPEKYLSEVAIKKYIKSKKEDFEDRTNNKIYIVNGHINEHGDTDTWIEEIFQDKLHATCCAAYLNITKAQDHVIFYVSEHDGFCNEDYISKLDELLKTQEDKK